MMKKTQKNRLPIYIVIGTRAQIIKVAPLMQLLEKAGISYSLINTNQHTEKMDDLLIDFGIRTKFLNIFNKGQEAKTINSFGLWCFRVLLVFLNPFSRKKIFHFGRGIVLTHGDTASTAWAAIYGRSSFCKVMHIEAGLRSHNIFHPFPEELMRIITGWFSNYHMCPTQEAVDNLKLYPGKKINTQANTMYDGVQFALGKISKDGGIVKQLTKELKLPAKFSIASIHRYENIFKIDVLTELISIIEETATTLPVAFILHPSTEIQLEKEGFYQSLHENKKIHFIPRLNFIEFIALTEMSEFLMVDSGGNQEEMSYTGKPTIILREATERSEGLGENIILSKLDRDIIKGFVANYTKYQRDPIKLASPSQGIYTTLMQIT